MATEREEQRQQRLRGTQQRQIKDVDFGFTFASVPAPLPSVPVPLRRSPRRSLELSAQPSTRPATDSRARSQPPAATPRDENVPTAVGSSTSVYNTTKYANTSAKRRKLDPDESSTSIRSVQSTVLAPRRDIYALAEDDVHDSEIERGAVTVVQPFLGAQLDAEVDMSTSLIIPTAERSPDPMAEEVTESPSQAPGSGQRMRAKNSAAMESSQLQDELQEDSGARSSPASSPIIQRKRKRATSKNADTVRARQTSISELSQSAEIDELSPEAPKRGRRRRSSIQRESLPSTVPMDSVDDRESAEEIDDYQAAAILKKHKGRRLATEPSPDLDESSEFTQPTQKGRRIGLQQPSSPAKQRHPKNSKPKANPMEPPKKQIRAGNPISITTYRSRNAPVYDEDEPDADILNSEIPHSKRPGVNTVDTLQTLINDIVVLALEKLEHSIETTRDQALTRDYKSQLKVVEDFGSEIQNRLTEHTINLDNTAALEKRVREEERKRLALREEVLRIKADREAVAVKMDAIRIKHEMESKDAQDQHTLSSSIHDIEVAVERGKETSKSDATLGPVQQVGVELLLQRIANEISNKSHSGGLLKQVKDFNAFLERTALALEGRKT